MDQIEINANKVRQIDQKRSEQQKLLNDLFGGISESRISLKTLDVIAVFLKELIGSLNLKNEDLTIKGKEAIQAITQTQEKIAQAEQIRQTIQSQIDEILNNTPTQEGGGGIQENPKEKEDKKP